MSERHASRPMAAGDKGADTGTQASQECHSLARVPTRPSLDGARLLAAAAYFAWLGYVTVPLPLLLLNLPAFRRRPKLAYHAWNATAWSLVVAAVRGGLVLAGAWSGTLSGDLAGSVCNTLSLIHLVLVLSFALLLSSWYGLRTLCGREVEIPWLSRWARERVRVLTA